MSLRTSAAIIAARLMNFAGRITGHQGVTLGGKLAMKIDPDILKKLASQVRGPIVVTCGTNGKTTTNNMLASVARASGKKVICNSTGSNMLMGVAAAFVLSASVTGKIDCDFAAIEVDEASTVRTFPYFKPDYMILTNLFRDQLDRYGEIDITMDLLKRALDMAPDCRVIYNADDVLCASLVKKSGHQGITYGIPREYKSASGNRNSDREIREGRFCQFCGTKLDYDFYHFSQLGSYHCPKCGFKRPDIEYAAENISLESGISFDLKHGEETLHIKTGYHGFYNIYNILAFSAAASETGLGTGQVEEVLTHFHPENGRMEEFHIGNHHVLLNLAKNPAGFNQNISAVMEDTEDKDIIIVINDNAQDGRDISWLWDVDFEELDRAHVKHITVSGLRAYDMELRLKYSDIPCEAVPDPKAAIAMELDKDMNNLYVLVNYTALYSTHNHLKALEKEA